LLHWADRDDICLGPDSPSCILIQGLCKDKKMEEDVDCNLKMLDQGWHPNVATLKKVNIIFPVLRKF
ncbi:hypothetical protein, partial [Actinobacillus pleuropneumoniae]|uniref:hypothetical protein n=1 Tax=Actinobacillus pleuropneumoniae TaxID=715 RepID=UPI00227B1173